MLKSPGEHLARRGFLTFQKFLEEIMHAQRDPVVLARGAIMLTLIRGPFQRKARLLDEFVFNAKARVQPGIRPASCCA
jgi:hypothetical protein